jgi:uncharacterized protein YdhG (YjbR/CyaY superfamily)
MAPRYATIDEYIAEHPPAVRRILEKIRKTIQAAAPAAEEAIKYQIPTFVLNGNLVHFAAYKEHIGLYPAPRAIAELAEELAPYVAGKGTLRFPLDEPIPYALIRKVVEHRVRQRLR